MTPAFVPSPAFECLGVDTVQCELKATKDLLDDYASGRLSVIHRLLHHGYQEVADALDALRESAPYSGTALPSGLSERAAAVLRATSEDSGDRPSLGVLRAAVTLGVVLGDALYVERAHAFMKTRRPDLVPALVRLSASVPA